jgi:hypothetical protein
LHSCVRATQRTYGLSRAFGDPKQNFNQNPQHQQHFTPLAPVLPPNNLKQSGHFIGRFLHTQVTGWLKSACTKDAGRSSPIQRSLALITQDHQSSTKGRKVRFQALELLRNILADCLQAGNAASLAFLPSTSFSQFRLALPGNIVLSTILQLPRRNQAQKPLHSPPQHRQRVK